MFERRAIPSVANSPPPKDGDFDHPGLGFFRFNLSDQLLGNTVSEWEIRYRIFGQGLAIVDRIECNLFSSNLN